MTSLDSTQATNWLTLCLVVITGLYCFYTYRIVQKNGEIVGQMKAQYECFIAPAITVTIQIKHLVFVYLKVRNCGRTTARNLRLTLDRDFYQFGETSEEHNIRQFPAFQQPIPSFSPGDELLFVMSQGFNLGKKHEGLEVTPYEFTVDIHYEFGERTIDQQHQINLRAYLQSAQDRNETVEELEKIRKLLQKKKITVGGN